MRVKAQHSLQLSAYDKTFIVQQLRIHHTVACHLQQLPSIMCILEEQKYQGDKVQDNESMDEFPDSRVWPN